MFEEFVSYVLMGISVVAAIAALVQKDLMKTVIMVGAESVALALIYQVLLAPDIALTQALVGTTLLPAIIIIAIYKTRRTEE